MFQTVTVNSRKFDQTIHRSWECRLIEQTGPELVLIGEFDSDISHPDLGHIRKGTLSFEYFWVDRWYSIFRFHEPDGLLRNYYCNVNMPPRFENGVLDYIDLDIDIVVWPDSRYQVLDEAEYTANATRFGYPAIVRENVSLALSDLISMIKNRDLPVG